MKQCLPEAVWLNAGIKHILEAGRLSAAIVEQILQKLVERRSYLLETLAQLENNMTRLEDTFFRKQSGMFNRLLQGLDIEDYDQSYLLYEPALKVSYGNKYSFFIIYRAEMEQYSFPRLFC